MKIKAYEKMDKFKTPKKTAPIKEDDLSELTLSVKQLRSLALRANAVKPKFFEGWFDEQILKLKQQKHEIQNP